jgi:large subunit ribosomal protein L25
MPDRPHLAAASRTVTGKAVAHLRKEGKLPAVVYGHGTASEPVLIDAHEFDALRRRTGASTLIDLAVDGGRTRPVLVHGVQVHPVSRRPLHVDLFAVRMTEELTVEVPLVGMGSAPAAVTGGTLVHPTASIRVRALPANLPEAITYDLVTLDSYEASITVADLVAPPGVTIQTDLSEIVARVLPPRVEEEVVPAVEAAEAEEAAEGEEAAAGEGAESPRPSGRRPLTYTIGSTSSRSSCDSARSRASSSASSAARWSGASDANRSSSSNWATNPR